MTGLPRGHGEKCSYYITMRSGGLAMPSATRCGCTPCSHHTDPKLQTPDDDQPGCERPHMAGEYRINVNITETAAFAISLQWNHGQCRPCSIDNLSLRESFSYLAP